jgi:hypothetical protein
MEWRKHLNSELLFLGPCVVGWIKHDDGSSSRAGELAYVSACKLPGVAVFTYSPTADEAKSAVESAVKLWFSQLPKQEENAKDNLLDSAYEEDGAVDGILECVDAQRVDAHGKFVIYDIIDRRAVKCEVNESQLQQALANLQKRVEVIGAVRYRKDGMPVSIKASKIINFPGKSEIPSLAQMRGLLAGNCDADIDSSVELVRSVLRDSVREMEF